MTTTDVDGLTRYYAAAARASCVEAPAQRHGQTIFNVLHEHRPDLANRVRGTLVDPFYVPDGETGKEARLMFIAWVFENWSEA